MNAIEVLHATRELIVDKKNWCAYMSRRDTDEGTQYCVSGAISEVTKNHNGSVMCNGAWRLLIDACRRLFGEEPEIKKAYPYFDGEEVVLVNDKLGHDAIILALDVAIGDYPEHAIKEPQTQSIADFAHQTTKGLK